MKRSLKTKLTTILLSLAMFFTVMPITTNTINAADEIELTVGAEYKYEDKIKISQDAYILIDEKLDAKRQVEANTYIFEKVTIRHNYVGEYLTVLYAVSNPSEVAFSLYLGHNKGYTGSLEERSRIIGIKCVGGDGTQSNPYKFDLLLTDKVIEVGTVFAKGETISFPKDAYILGDDKFSNIKQQVITGEYTVGDFTWIADNGQYSCDTNFKLASGTLDLRLGYGKGYTGSDEEKASIIGVKCISGTGYYSDPYTFAIEFASQTTTHTVTYKIVNGTWSDGKNNPITEDVKEGQTPSNIPTGMQPISDEYPVGSWDKDPSKTSITGNTEFTYKFSASDAMVLSVTNYSGTYDGNSQGSTATATANVDGATIQYSTDGGATWSTTVPTRKDVGTIEVIAKATARGYVEKTAKYNLKITPKPITIKTGSAMKQYDGWPLTNDEVEISGLVNGETATVKANGSQIELGSSTNTYSIDWGATKASNYDITEDLGTLTVNYTTEITLTAASDSKTYDGKPLTNTNVTATGLPPDFIVVNVRMTPVSTITDVGTIPNVIDSYEIKNHAGEDKTVNFTNVTKAAGTLEITRKSVTVKADNKTKAFGDKDPEFTATVQGLLQGDESLLKYTLSREPVEVVGVHEIKATGEEEQGNYVVSYENGTLTIVASNVTYTNEAGNNGSWTKGDTDTLNFTFKRTPEISFDEYQRLLTSVEVDGQKTTEYEISKGSIIVKLKSSLLQDLEVGNHILTINFNDGHSVSANFTIKEKGNNNNNNNNKTYYIPKTGVE